MTTKSIFITLAIFISWNIIVFLSYAYDKYKAQNQLWRTPESTLIFQAIFGGGLGAFMGGKICHHKTRKTKFWVAWYIGLAIDFILVLLISGIALGYFKSLNDVFFYGIQEIRSYYFDF